MGFFENLREHNSPISCSAFFAPCSLHSQIQLSYKKNDNTILTFTTKYASFLPQNMKKWTFLNICESTPQFLVLHFWCSRSAAIFTERKITMRLQKKHRRLSEDLQEPRFIVWFNNILEKKNWQQNLHDKIRFIFCI